MYDEIVLKQAINDSEVKRETVFAEIDSITQNEFNVAGQNGIKASYKFTVYKFEYGNQTDIEYAGIRLTVYRTYSIPDTDKIELYTAERIGKR